MHRFRGVRPTTWLTLGVLALLPVLAVMQYHWLSRIGDDAGARMRAVAENAAQALSRDLGFELLQVWRDRTGGGGGTDDSDIERSLIVDALVIDTLEGAGGLRIRQWDLDARECRPIAWPDDLASLREELLERLERARRAGEAERGASSVIVPLQRVGASVGVFPLTVVGGNEAPSFARPPCPTSAPAVVLVRFDGVQVRDSLLPELFRRHLAELASEFRFAIVDQDGNRTVYSPPGVDASLLTVAPDITAPIVLGRDNGGRGGRDGREGRRGSALLERGNRGGDEHHDHRPAGWVVVGRHRAGSLESAVANLRARNLAVSLGILALMGVAITMIAVNARRAERLGRQQVEFVASVSHEMRTPVAAIDVAARNLEDGVVSDPARVKQYGGVIRHEAGRLAGTVERVLQLAQLEASPGARPLTRLDIRPVVSEVVDLARREYPAASVEVDDTGREAMVVGDLALVRSCVQNLVGNALKYGGTPPWVRVRLLAGTEDDIRVSVEDRGPGIDARDRAHVFEPFYRGRLAIERRLPGNGIGLHLVKRSMTAMDGRVELTSTSPTGTTLTLVFPSPKTAAPWSTDAVAESRASHVPTPPSG